MTTRGFGASTPRDLLERAKHEVVELDRAIQTYYLSEHEGRNKVGSLAAACAASLWNVVDWLARTSDPSSRAAVYAAGYMDYKSVRDYVKGASADLTLCWEVTNGVKHCELDGHTLKSSQIDAAELSDIVSSPASDAPLAFRFVPKIKTKTANLPALQVYQGAVGFWESFFASLGI